MTQSALSRLKNRRLFGECIGLTRKVDVGDDIPTPSPCLGDRLSCAPVLSLATLIATLSLSLSPTLLLCLSLSLSLYLCLSALSLRSCRRDRRGKENVRRLGNHQSTVVFCERTPKSVVLGVREREEPDAVSHQSHDKKNGDDEGDAKLNCGASSRQVEHPHFVTSTPKAHATVLLKLKMERTPPTRDDPDRRIDYEDEIFLQQCIRVKRRPSALPW